MAQVLGEQGFEDVARAILRTALTRPDTAYPNWKMGEKLLGSATHFRLFRDRAYLAGATPALRGYVATLGRQIDASPTGLLGRERYSSDIHDPVYGLHSQAVVWAGLRGMADAWQQTGQAALAARCRALAARLEAGLRQGGARVAAPPARRLALRAGAPARRRGAVRLARGGPRGQLLEPRHALRARLRPLRPGRRRGDGHLALHAAARLAPARARPRRRLRALRPRRAVPRLRHRPGLRDQRVALPRRPRRGRPARARACTASSPRR